MYVFLSLFFFFAKKKGKMDRACIMRHICSYVHRFYFLLTIVIVFFRLKVMGSGGFLLKEQQQQD